VQLFGGVSGVLLVDSYSNKHFFCWGLLILILFLFFFFENVVMSMYCAIFIPAWHNHMLCIYLFFALVLILYIYIIYIYIYWKMIVIYVLCAILMPFCFVYGIIMYYLCIFFWQLIHFWDTYDFIFRFIEQSFINILILFTFFVDCFIILQWGQLKRNVLLSAFFLFFFFLFCWKYLWSILLLLLLIFIFIFSLKRVVYHKLEKTYFVTK